MKIYIIKHDDTDDMHLSAHLTYKGAMLKAVADMVYEIEHYHTIEDESWHELLEAAHRQLKSTKVKVSDLEISYTLLQDIGFEHGWYYTGIQENTLHP